MSDMTLTMTFKAVDEATAVMKQIMATEKEVHASVAASSQASSAAASSAVSAAERQVVAIERVASVAKEVAAEVARSQADRVFGGIEWEADNADQIAAKAELQNLRDLADQQRRFREDENFAQSLIDGLGGAVPAVVADAITPPEPPKPAWSDRKWGGIEWIDDTAEQARGREETRMMRAFAAEAEAAQELQRQLSPLKDTASDIADVMGGIGGNAEPAAGGLRKLGTAAAEAIPNLIEAAKGLMQTEGLAREFAVAFGRVAGSLGSALLVSGVEFAVSQMIGFVHEAVTGEKELEMALKNHANIVKEVGAAYRQTKDAAGEYRGTALEALEFRAQQNAAKMENIYAASLSELASAKALEERSFMSPLADLGPFAETIAQWKQAVEAGSEGAGDLERRIGSIAAALPADDAFRRRQAEVILAQTEDALAKELQLEEARRAHNQAIEARAGAGGSGKVVADASAEMQAAVDVAAEIEPAMRAAADGIDQGSRAFSEVDPAASSAASAIGSAANEIARVSQNAQAAAADLAQLKTALQDAASARISGQAAPASAPAAANSNRPGFSKGGYTGDIPVDAVAGDVHGQEFVFDAPTTAAIGRNRLAALAASPEMLSGAAARSQVARLLAVGGGSPISVQMSAPVTISGNAPRADIEREVLDVMEKSGRRLGEIIDEELRLRSRRQH